jgi:hypothetical protein
MKKFLPIGQIVVDRLKEDNRYRLKQMNDFIEDDEKKLFIYDRQLNNILFELPEGCQIAPNKVIWKEDEVMSRYSLIVQKEK